MPEQVQSVSLFCPSISVYQCLVIAKIDEQIDHKNYMGSIQKFIRLHITQFYDPTSFQ